MKFTLKPNAELDLITADEVRGIVNELLTPWARGPQTMRPGAAFTLSAGGAGSASVYQVPAGMKFRLHRLLIDVEGAYNPGAPYTSNSGYADVLRGGVREDFAVFTGGLPAVFTWSDAQALEYSNGETVDVSIIGGPASGVIILRAQGTLQPITTD